MNAKRMTMMLMGLMMVGMGTTRVMGSDLSRFLEHTRVNVSYVGGPGYGLYAPNYGPVYAGQYPVPYGPYPQSAPGYLPQPVYYAPAPVPMLNPVVAVSFGGRVAAPHSNCHDRDDFHRGEGHHHLYSGGGWNHHE